MNPELQNKLYEKYPLIFQDKDLPMSQTCMCWGLEISDGWYDLIDKLCHFLQWHTDKNKYPQVIADQVKEKYGQLCFYCHNDNDMQHGAISFAESMSTKICEVCGSSGSLKQRGGWYKTLCDNHAKELEYDNIKPINK